MVTRGLGFAWWWPIPVCYMARSHDADDSEMPAHLTNPLVSSCSPRTLDYRVHVGKLCNTKRTCILNFVTCNRRPSWCCCAALNNILFVRWYAGHSCSSLISSFLMHPGGGGFRSSCLLGECFFWRTWRADSWSKKHLTCCVVTGSSRAFWLLLWHVLMPTGPTCSRALKLDLLLMIWVSGGGRAASSNYIFLSGAS